MGGAWLKSETEVCAVVHTDGFCFNLGCDIGGGSALEAPRREQEMTDILRTIDLSKRFGKTLVLDHLNMSVPEQSMYGLVGPNGAGKTTTIKILMNVLQPTEGMAEVFGRDCRSRRDSLRISKTSRGSRPVAAH